MYNIPINILPIKYMKLQNESDSNILLYAIYLFTEVALYLRIGCCCQNNIVILFSIYADIKNVKTKTYS